VPQDLHGHPWVHVERGQERAAGFASAVEGDPAHLGAGYPAVETPAEVTRLDRCPASCREHQPPSQAVPDPQGGGRLAGPDHPLDQDQLRRVHNFRLRGGPEPAESVVGRRSALLSFGRMGEGWIFTVGSAPREIRSRLPPP